MNKKEEREQFWISVGPESGYLGTIAAETARKNDGGISPDGERLGWNNTGDDDYGNGVAEGWDADDIATEYPYGDPCDCATKGDCTTKGNCACDDCNCDPCERPAQGNCDCKDCACDPCTCASLPLPGVMPSGIPGLMPVEECNAVPPADRGPEQQNTQG